MEYVFRWVLKAAAVYKDLYRLEKEKIKRVFADAKEKHGMHYMQYRGLARVTNLVKLKVTSMNLKKRPPGNGRTSSGTGQRSRSRENTPNISLLFPFVFLLINQKPALA